MQYVTKFFNVIGSYYGEIGINEANSTGAIDVIVIEQPDGSYRCTPFHVRLGKLNIFRPKEVIVDIYLNSEYVKDIEMRVEPTGQAYFELQGDGSNGNSNCDINQIRNKQPNAASATDDEISKDLEINISSERFQSSDESNSICSSTERLSPIEDQQLCESFMSKREAVERNHKNLTRPQRNVRISLCGKQQESENVTNNYIENFFTHIVSYEKFIENPLDVLNNSSLAVEYKGEIMDWQTFSILIVMDLVYNKSLSQKSLRKILNKIGEIEESSKQSVNQKDFVHNERIDNTLNIPDEVTLYNIRSRTLSGDIYFSQEDQESYDLHKNTQGSGQNNYGMYPTKDIQTCSVDDSGLHFPHKGMKKTNVLPNKFLKLLKLNDGVNELMYVITGKYRGTIKVGCKLYLWHWYDRIVISDIDGTITRSDVWGQLGPYFGLDWTQPGIVELYNNIQKNNFRIVYLSARAIGLAEQTRQYLSSVNQQHSFLPDGPLLLAPSSLFVAFKKEVIDRNPEEFKICCLQELRCIFPLAENSTPLYAGFGNKPSDEATYKAVGIPESKIFTVNKKGEVYNKALNKDIGCSITYEALSKQVDFYFPSVKEDVSNLIEYSSFSYWKSGISVDEQ